MESWWAEGGGVEPREACEEAVVMSEGGKGGN